MCDARHGAASDAELIRRLQGGEMAAFDALFAGHRGPLFGYVFGLLGDRGLAEDIVQDVFIAFVRGIGKIDPKRGARAWLLRVARNKVIDLWRKRGHERSLEQPGEGAPAERLSEDDPLRQLLGRERQAGLLAAVRALPARERDVLLLHYFSDMPFKDVARTLRRPLGTVLWQSRRGIARLRHKWERS